MRLGAIVATDAMLTAADAVVMQYPTITALDVRKSPPIILVQCIGIHVIDVSV